MNIRYLVMLLSLSCSMLLHSSQSDKEWQEFKATHDMYLLVKHVNKNEDRWVKFEFANLPDDPHQATWIERADFLPIERKVECDSLLQTEGLQHGTVYEQTVGGPSRDDKFIMLMVGFFKPNEKVYRFVMDPYYHCISVIVVEKSNPKKDKLMQFAEYYQKIKTLFSDTWQAIIN